MLRVHAIATRRSSAHHHAALPIWMHHPIFRFGFHDDFFKIFDDDDDLPTKNTHQKIGKEHTPPNWFLRSFSVLFCSLFLPVFGDVKNNFDKRTTFRLGSPQKSLSHRSRVHV